VRYDGAVIFKLKNMAKSKSNKNQSFKIDGENLIQKVKELIHEGNVRKIVIKDEKGKYTLLEIPVTVGVIGTLVLPVLAAVGALAAMVGLVTVEVINTESTEKTEKKTKPTKKK
jgi:hypothetical protein